MRRAPRMAPPPIAPAVEVLAASVPALCSCGCRAVDFRTVAGGDDRRPVVDVTFACGRVETVPDGVR